MIVKNLIVIIRKPKENQKPHGTYILSINFILFFILTLELKIIGWK